MKKADLPKNYKPSEKEEFMCDLQLSYFRKKLSEWKERIARESRPQLDELKEVDQKAADIADRASIEIDRSLELRNRDRERRLVEKIDEALQRIDEGTYGYCEETGDKISLKRLEARPIATLSIEAQERHERLQKTRR